MLHAQKREVRLTGQHGVMGRQDGDLNMKKPVQENRRSAIALRLFEALCERYPDKYVTLIQPRAKKGQRRQMPSNRSRASAA